MNSLSFDPITSIARALMSLSHTLPFQFNTCRTLLATFQARFFGKQAQSTIKSTQIQHRKHAFFHSHRHCRISRIGCIRTGELYNRVYNEAHCSSSRLTFDAGRIHQWLHIVPHGDEQPRRGDWPAQRCHHAACRDHHAGDTTRRRHVSTRCGDYPSRSPSWLDKYLPER